MADVNHQRWVLEVTNREGTVPRASLVPQTFTIIDTLGGGRELRGLVDAREPGAVDLDVGQRVVRAWALPRAPASPGQRVCRFAGHVYAPLADVEDADGTAHVEFIAKGPWAAIAQRYLAGRGGEWSYVATDAGNIAGDLLSRAMEFWTPSAGSNPDVISNHGLGALITASTSRDRTYQPHQNIRDAVVQLSEVQGGFYFREQPRVPVSNGFIADLVITPTPGFTRSTHPLQYGEGTIGNVEAVTRVERIMPANHIVALGQPPQFAEAFDTLSIDQYGAWTEVVSHPTATNTATLLIHAQDAMRPAPVDVVHLTVSSEDPTDRAPRVPRLWEDFDVGDRLPTHLRLVRRTITADALVRSASITVDADGRERLGDLVLEV